MNNFLPTAEIMDLASRLAAAGDSALDQDVRVAAASLAYLTGQRDLAEMMIRSTRVQSFLEGLEHGYYECRRAHNIQEDAPSQIPRTHGRAIDVLQERIAALQAEEDGMGLDTGRALIASYQAAIEALQVERP
jgi:hypothetical protein